MKTKLILFLLLVNSALFFAQTPAVDVPITVGNGSLTQVLHLGLDPAATDGIDAGLGEAALSAYSGSAFDARVFIPSASATSLSDFRTGTSSFVGTKTHFIQFHPGTSSFVTIAWNLPAGITGRLQDVLGGTSIDQSMSGSGAYTNFSPGTYNTLQITLTYNLNTSGVPSIPTLSAPANGLTGVAVPTTLSWAASAGATSYTLQVSTANDFSTTVYSQSGLTATSQSVPGLTTGSTYYWRVSATNANGTSDYSTVYSFSTVDAPPAAPVLIYPSDGAPDISLNPTLTWNASSGALTYNLQVSTVNDFSTTVINLTGINSTSYSLTNLTQGIVYYWRVSATNANGTGSYSNTRTFRAIITSAPSTPTPLTPATTSTGVSLNPTFTWTNNGGATSYNLVVSRDAFMTDIVINQLSITGTSYRLTGGLELNKTYYWYVSARNTYGSSSYSPIQNFTTTAVPTIPEAPILSSPYNAATSVSYEPTTLSWVTQAGVDSFNVQVSLVSDFTTLLKNVTGIKTTSYNALGLSMNTTYYWRVRATNSAGTGAFSSTWSFTTSNIPLIPPVPVLSSPVDSAVNISQWPTFVWSSSLGATKYFIQLSRTADFSLVVKNDSTLSTTYSLTDTLVKGTSYFWRVRAVNANYSSAYSTSKMFTVINDIPDIPLLVSPVDGGNINANPVLTWGAAARASYYNLQISLTSDFSSIVFVKSGITGTTYDLNSGSFSSTEYYWRVSASNSTGTSSYSASRKFIVTAIVPASPVLAYPTNNAVNISLNTILSWSPSDRADSYTLQVSKTTSFTTKVIDQSGITETGYSVTGLESNTTYYWRVKATNAYGSSSFSSISGFTTLAGPPSAPTLVTPANNATGITLSPTAFSWNSVGGALYYTLQVSLASDFSTLVVNQSNITTTSYSVSTLAGNTKYYWRISATNSYGTGANSATSNFTTVGIVPTAPVLVSPANNAVGIPATTMLTWNASANATTYSVEVSDHTSFPTLVASAYGITATSYSVTGLIAGKTYYWRVSATNAYGTSSYSATSSFTTTSLKYGNITGTGTISSLDAIEALRMSVGFTTSYTQPVFTYTASHYALADVDNNHVAGFVYGSYAVSAYDAYKILWKSLNPTVNLLPIEGGPAKVAASTGELGVDKTVSKAGNGVINIPLTIKNAFNVHSVTFNLKYDASRAEIKGLTSNLPSDWISAYYAKDGEAKIVLAGLSEINADIVANLAVKINHKEDFINLYGTASVNENDAVEISPVSVNQIPDNFALNQNYPNPFNPSTKISYSVPSDCNVKITVYNTLGQVVKEIVNEVKKAGYYESTFNASGLSSGIYFYAMTAKSVDGLNSFTNVKKLILMK